jgi:hypothetical protein
MWPALAAISSAIAAVVAAISARNSGRQVQYQLRAWYKIERTRLETEALRQAFLAIPDAYSAAQVAVTSAEQQRKQLASHHEEYRESERSIRSGLLQRWESFDSSIRSASAALLVINPGSPVVGALEATRAHAAELVDRLMENLHVFTTEDALNTSPAAEELRASIATTSSEIVERLKFLLRGTGESE